MYVAISIVFGLIGFFATINLLYSLIFIISFTIANGFYRWLVKEAEFLEIIYFPLFGPTYSVATRIYERSNWFVARLLLICYSILLLLLLIIFFILFYKFAVR
ncbi:hypothetical protein ELQ35_20580 [Peribacillus cavernae]|uniref:Uncharacterized protein n=1 Tax=Peribacillus cavernae TaxID=1674310 RepID=A0A3S0TX27_9BACI|nr:hypothetical protein [Peribacillus cavernae]RUQ25177.1 hypothetical protein ELQ35_20580 [Peribacillus cavernae]